MRSLYERGYPREDVQRLFGFIDWLMELPEDLDEQFWRDVQQYEEEKHMPYISGVERRAEQRGLEQGLERGIEQGLRQGLLEGLALGLELKFVLGPSVCCRAFAGSKTWPGCNPCTSSSSGLAPWTNFGRHCREPFRSMGSGQKEVVVLVSPTSSPYCLTILGFDSTILPLWSATRK